MQFKKDITRCKIGAISPHCNRLHHSGACSNQNALNPDGHHEGAAECGCNGLTAEIFWAPPGVMVRMQATTERETSLLRQLLDSKVGARYAKALAESMRPSQELQERVAAHDFSPDSDVCKCGMTRQRFEDVHDFDTKDCKAVIRYIYGGTDWRAIYGTHGE